MFDFKITPDEGDTFELTAGMRDIVMWERTHKGRAFAQLGDGGMSATMLYEIAYSACRRQGLVPREISEQQFIASYEIELGEDEPAAEPEAPPTPDDEDDDSDPMIDPFDGFAIGSPAGAARRHAAAELRADPEDTHPDDRDEAAPDPTRSGA
jgi:hypothetical protein